MVKNLPADAGGEDSVSGLEGSSAEGNSNPLQYSCLGNPKDRGAWWAGYSPWGHKRVIQDLATK